MTRLQIARGWETRRRTDEGQILGGRGRFDVMLLFSFFSPPNGIW